MQWGCCVILWSSLIKLTFGSLSTLCGNIPHYYYGKKTVQLVAWSTINPFAKLPDVQYLGNICNKVNWLAKDWTETDRRYDLPICPAVVSPQCCRVSNVFILTSATVEENWSVLARPVSPTQPSPADCIITGNFSTPQNIPKQIENIQNYHRARSLPRHSTKFPGWLLWSLSKMWHLGRVKWWGLAQAQHWQIIYISNLTALFIIIVHKRKLVTASSERRLWIPTAGLIAAVTSIILRAGSPSCIKPH